MKGGVAMMVAAFLRAKAEALVPPGDIILAVVSDEEDGGTYGAKYLVEDHADQFAGVRYAIGEFGGFSFYVGRKKLYPIMVAEKAVCWVTATMRGASGHPSAAFHGGAITKLGKALQQLDRKHLPAHITPAARLMIQTMSTVLPFPSNLVLRQLVNPKLTDRVLKLLGKQVEQFETVLHNTANVTVISGADNIHNIPDRIVLTLVCLLLPGYGPDDIIAELRPILGQDIELQAEHTAFFEPIPAEPDMGLYGTLADILLEADPNGAPAPIQFPGTTDGRYFSRLGIQTYGFTPMQFPPSLRFWELAHAADERIPVESLTFGTDAIYKLLQRFGKQSK
jgi:acetylornithine deacetylase/succinyl-diaminopimelate desuccinylase-like protein